MAYRILYIICIFLVFSFFVPSGTLFAETKVEVQKLTTLSLQEIMQRISKQSLNVQLAKNTRNSTDLNEALQKDSFVPILSVGANYHRRYAWGDFSAPGSVLLDSSIFWRSTIGTELRAGLSATIKESATESNMNSLSAQGRITGSPQSTLMFSLSQDLLAGAWGADNEIDIVRTDTKIARLNYIADLNVQLLRGARLYFALMTAQTNRSISTRSVQRAEKQFKDTQENIKRGLMAPGDIYVVEENLVFFKQQALRAEEEYRVASKQFASLLNVEGLIEIPGLQEEHIEDLTEQTIEKNPRLQSRNLQIEQSKERLRNAKQNRLPSLSLSLAVGFDGLDASLGYAFRESISLDNPDLRAGVQLSSPLWFASKNAEVARAELSLQREELLKTQEINKLKEERYIAKERLRLREEIFILAEKRFQLSELKLKTELEKYKNGVSRLPEVVRFQRDVDSADFARTRASVQKTLAKLEWIASMGLLHETFGVKVR